MPIKLISSLRRVVGAFAPAEPPAPPPEHTGEELDREWYLRTYKDLTGTGIDALAHYLEYGRQEGRYPNRVALRSAVAAKFRPQWYLANYPDVAAAGLDPLEHYLDWGFGEGRSLLPPSALPMTATCPAPFTPEPEVTARFARVGPPDTSSRSDTGRVAIFAAYSADETIHRYVIHYLRELRKVTDRIVFVADNTFSENELMKIRGIADILLCEHHGEYDFGSWKRGIALARAHGLLNNADELLICNDSCYGPIDTFETLFAEMAERPCDFWSITDNNQFGFHLQSYFVLFKRAVFQSPKFDAFFGAVEKQPSAMDVIRTYEVPMTAFFTDAGYRPACFITDELPGVAAARKLESSLIVSPLTLLNAGCPLIKVKAFKYLRSNMDGVGSTLHEVERRSPFLYTCILEHARPSCFLDAAGVSFSIITPFHNRKATLFDAIDSVLAQRHQGFELILIDDGSTDGAGEEIERRYPAQLASGRIKLLRNPEPTGVSAARNAGLAHATGDWIAYLDSDNTLLPNFLSIFSELVIESPGQQLFFSARRLMSDGSIQYAAAFDKLRLWKGNYIDLGAFVHSSAMYFKHGGFDTSLRRLVDWDLILRYTYSSSVDGIYFPLMNYNDSLDDSSRISVRESLDTARIYLRKKHAMPFFVTTIIPVFGHARHLEQAIETALFQAGNVRQELLLFGDGVSGDATELIARYASAYPSIIRDLSGANACVGSAVYQYCISQANGDFIAFIDGDDYWSDANKLHKQTSFLAANLECSMVFSMTSVRDMLTGTTSLPDLQVRIATDRISGDVLRDPGMNPIQNLTSCLFKTALLRDAPANIYEERCNAIPLSVYSAQHGPVGFIPEALCVHRLKPA